jgi:hypothetical protein
MVYAVIHLHGTFRRDARLGSATLISVEKLNEMAQAEELMRQFARRPPVIDSCGSRLKPQLLDSPTGRVGGVSW